MIEQITVFLENASGRLAALCRALGDAGISMHALTVADTADYGVARIIADRPEQAYQVLDKAGFRASLTKVFAIEVPDHAGGLAALLETFNAAGINVEYAYCFAAEGGKAIDVLRIDDYSQVEHLVNGAGFRIMQPSELYKTD
jgi:hypothetical protein